MSSTTKTIPIFSPCLQIHSLFHSSCLGAGDLASCFHEKTRVLSCELLHLSLAGFPPQLLLFARLMSNAHHVPPSGVRLPLSFPPVPSTDVMATHILKSPFSYKGTFPMHCYSPRFLPCPLPFSIKPLSRTVYHLPPFAHHPLIPSPLHRHSLIKDTKDHIISITKSLPLYVSQFNSGVSREPITFQAVLGSFYHSHHFFPLGVGAPLAPAPLPPPRLHSSDCAFPSRPQSTKGRLTQFVSWPFSSLFSDIYSPDFRVHFYK